MLTMTSADDLERSARLRQRHGLSTWLPVRMECEDGLLSLLPGDHMYPANPEYTGPSGDRSVTKPDLISIGESLQIQSLLILLNVRALNTKN